MNSNQIETLKVENFKSIKQVNINCKRVNVFIGKPNVGKSNLLEAIALLSDLNQVRDIVRFNKPFELFYDGEINSTIKVITNHLGILINRVPNQSYFDIFKSNEPIGMMDAFDGDGVASVVNLDNIYKEVRSQENDFEENRSNELPIISRYHSSDLQSYTLNSQSSFPPSNIRKYAFRTLNLYSKQGNSYLTAPHGDNLWHIIQSNKELRNKISELFNEYSLEFVLDLTNETFEIQKRINNFVYKYDYGLIADTLQRIIFYYAAIASNKNSVLLFEEPEAHSYPGYIRDLAIEIAQSESNQFFIATHSPYMLSTLMENLNFNDCAIFVCSYNNFQTQIKELSEIEVNEAIDFGQDLFFNVDSIIA